MNGAASLSPVYPAGFSTRPIFVRDEGYRAFVNRLRANRGLPALSMDDMVAKWEGMDVGGLVPLRSVQ